MFKSFALLLGNQLDVSKVILDLPEENAIRSYCSAFDLDAQSYHFNFILSLVLCCFCLSFIYFSLSCLVNFSGS